MEDEVNFMFRYKAHVFDLLSQLQTVQMQVSDLKKYISLSTDRWACRYSDFFDRLPDDRFRVRVFVFCKPIFLS